MIVKCYISGILIKSGDEFKNEPTVIDTHPIFKVSVRSLLARAKRWGLGGYSAQEEKLLFLALLNSTNAVEWEVPATPSEQVVKKNLESMFKLVAWYDKVITEGSMIKLPKLRVTQQNQGIENIPVFIRTWYDVRTEWLAPTVRRLKEELLEEREFRIHKLIHSANRNPFRYARLLGSWALDAAGVKGDDKRAEWLELFCLNPDKDLFKADIEELKDLQNWMQEHLYAPGSIGANGGTEYTAEVLKHLDKLVRTHEAGLLGLLGGFADGNLHGGFKIKYSIEDLGMESLEDIQKQDQQNQQAPSQEPKKEDYPGKLSDYIRAKAAWVLNSSLQERISYLHNQRESKELSNG